MEGRESNRMCHHFVEGGVEGRESNRMCHPFVEGGVEGRESNRMCRHFQLKFWKQSGQVLSGWLKALFSFKIDTKIVCCFKILTKVFVEASSVSLSLWLFN